MFNLIPKGFPYKRVIQFTMKISILFIEAVMISSVDHLMRKTALLCGRINNISYCEPESYNAMIMTWQLLKLCLFNSGLSAIYDSLTCQSSNYFITNFNILDTGFMLMLNFVFS